MWIVCFQWSMFCVTFGLTLKGLSRDCGDAQTFIVSFVSKYPERLVPDSFWWFLKNERVYRHSGCFWSHIRATCIESYQTSFPSHSDALWKPFVHAYVVKALAGAEMRSREINVQIWSRAGSRSQEQVVQPEIIRSILVNHESMANKNIIKVPFIKLQVTIFHRRQMKRFLAWKRDKCSDLLWDFKL
jgi:hypothetical protein